MMMMRLLCVFIFMVFIWLPDVVAQTNMTTTGIEGTEDVTVTFTVTVTESVNVTANTDSMATGTTESGTTENGGGGGEGEGEGEGGAPNTTEEGNGTTESGTTESGATDDEEQGEATATTAAGNEATENGGGATTAAGNGATENGGGATTAAGNEATENGGGEGEQGETTATTAAGNGVTENSNGNGNGNGNDASVVYSISGVVITNPDDAIFGLETGQNVHVDVSIVLSSSSDPVTGTSNWACYFGLTNDTTTTLDDDSVHSFANEEATIEPAADVGKNLAAGETYTFSAVATLPLVNITKCEYTHLCVVFTPHAAATWTITEDSVYVKCQEVMCGVAAMKLHLALVAVVLCIHALHKGVFCS
ncbi:mucin-21-like isoform X1 [Anneissia japonica]|uniref:mucin-21-like isoform X1 n=1 Tax=Anneissia japonica TaxID=1529436 RepID=UPI001425B3A9|nr:mucin-21-like isoform X1 [Anneissia japonica]